MKFKYLVNIIAIFILVFVSGCGGRAANPIMVQQYGDNNKSCNALEREMSFTQSELQHLIPKTDKTGKNVALGIAGFFLLVPLFFMDLTQAEQVEVNSLRQRYNHLLIIAEDKKCRIESEYIPEFDKRNEVDSDDK